MTNTKQAERNAVEFGKHVNAPHWYNGFLVACSVERKPAGSRSSLGSDDQKIGVAAFSKSSHQHSTKVAAYLDAWDSAASEGLVPTSDELTPIDADAGMDFDPDVHTDELWCGYFDALMAGTREKSRNYDKRRKPTKEQIATAIKSDPEVEKVAYNAIVEKQAEKREKFIKDREKAGVSRETIEKPIEPSKGAMSNAMDYAVEEAGRREQIHELQDLAVQIKEKAQKLVEDYNHTGVDDEIDWLHEIAHNLTEAQWALTGFMVENSDQESR